MIVVIGVLAAITIVSYSGISKKAVAASLQSDLTGAARLLKVFNVDTGRYPATISTDCAAQPDSGTNKCLKPTPGNTYTYSSPSPHTTFSLTVSNGSVRYRITDNTAPLELPPPVIATGGTVTDADGYRTHTFTSNGTFSVTAGGTVEISVSGGGGGGGTSWWNSSLCGYEELPAVPGGQSAISYGGTSFAAQGGGGGGTCGVNGSSGNVVITNGGSFVNTANPIIGGGGAGGAALACSYGGGRGGSGGRIEGSLAVQAGQTISVSVGQGGGGGMGGCGGDYEYSNPGAPGVITFRYQD